LSKLIYRLFVSRNTLTPFNIVLIPSITKSPPNAALTLNVSLVVLLRISSTPFVPVAVIFKYIVSGSTVSLPAFQILKLLSVNLYFVLSELILSTKPYFSTIASYPVSFSSLVVYNDTQNGLSTVRALIVISP